MSKIKKAICSIAFLFAASLSITGVASVQPSPAKTEIADLNVYVNPGYGCYGGCWGPYYGPYYGPYPRPFLGPRPCYGYYRGPWIPPCGPCGPYWY